MLPVLFLQLYRGFTYKPCNCSTGLSHKPSLFLTAHPSSSRVTSSRRFTPPFLDLPSQHFFEGSSRAINLCLVWAGVKSGFFQSADSLIFGGKTQLLPQIISPCFSRGRKSFINFPPFHIFQGLKITIFSPTTTDFGQEISQYFPHCNCSLFWARNLTTFPPFPQDNLPWHSRP